MTEEKTNKISIYLLKPGKSPDDILKGVHKEIKKGYIKFELEKPEMGKDVFIRFSTRDEKSGRVEYHSTKDLRKIINKTLENTAWRLMSEGISYRLGFLSGRLRGYEREEDLIKLVK